MSVISFYVDSVLPGTLAPNTLYIYKTGPGNFSEVMTDATGLPYLLSLSAGTNTIRNGIGAPAPGLGIVNDFYIDTAAITIYGPKTVLGWGPPTSLVGPVTAPTLIVASENLSSGAIVNVWNNGGTFNVRNSDNGAAGKEANGYVLAAVSMGSLARVFQVGPNNQLGGLVADSAYYLGTAGGVTLTPPDATNPANTGKVIQLIGYPYSPTILAFDADAPIYL